MASACVLIIEPITRKILTVSRKDNPNDKGLPGGKVEDGESERDAAVRELREETGAFALADHLQEVYRRDGSVTFQLDIRDLVYVGDRASGERGVVDWSTKEELLAGCFGEYNRNLLTQVGEL